MSVVNSVETVWLIEDNELKKTNKLVSKLNYKGMELAVLKTELDNYNQDVLIIQIDQKKSCYLQGQQKYIQQPIEQVPLQKL